MLQSALPLSAPLPSEQPLQDGKSASENCVSAVYAEAQIDPNLEDPLEYALNSSITTGDPHYHYIGLGHTY